jgi:hypothetical protein
VSARDNTSTARTGYLADRDTAARCTCGIRTDRRDVVGARRIASGGRGLCTLEEWWDLRRALMLPGLRLNSQSVRKGMVLGVVAST